MSAPARFAESLRAPRCAPMHTLRPPHRVLGSRDADSREQPHIVKLSAPSEHVELRQKQIADHRVDRRAAALVDHDDDCLAAEDLPLEAGKGAGSVELAEERGEVGVGPHDDDVARLRDGAGLGAAAEGLDADAHLRGHRSGEQGVGQQPACVQRRRGKRRCQSTSSGTPLRNPFRMRNSLRMRRWGATEEEREKPSVRARAERKGDGKGAASAGRLLGVGRTSRDTRPRGPDAVAQGDGPPERSLLHACFPEDKPAGGWADQRSGGQGVLKLATGVPPGDGGGHSFLTAPGDATERDPARCQQCEKDHRERWIPVEQSVELRWFGG